MDSYPPLVAAANTFLHFSVYILAGGFAILMITPKSHYFFKYVFVGYAFLFFFNFACIGFVTNALFNHVAFILKHITTSTISINDRIVTDRYPIGTALFSKRITCPTKNDIDRSKLEKKPLSIIIREGDETLKIVVGKITLIDNTIIYSLRYADPDRYYVGATDCIITHAFDPYYDDFRPPS